MKSFTSRCLILSSLLVLTGCASSACGTIDPILMEPPRPTPIIDAIVTSTENSSKPGETRDN